MKHQPESFNKLFVDGTLFVTKQKSNLKEAMMSIYDRILLRRSVIIEIVNDELKYIVQVENSRHRSFDNFIVNILGVIVLIAVFLRSHASMLLERFIHSLHYSEFVELKLL